MLALAFAAALFGASLPPPLEPAARGQQQCYGYDRLRKLCGAMASYAPGGDGLIANTATVALSPVLPIAMTTTTAVRIKEGRVCGRIEAADLQAASFLVDGQPAAAKDAEMLRGQVARAYAPQLGHEVCTRFETAEDHLMARAFIDGQAHPELDQRVIWVAPSEGYKVAQNAFSLQQLKQAPATTRH